MDVSAAGDRRREPQTDAELLEHDRDRLVGAAALHDRIRELAAGEEARFFAVLRNEVRFREAFEEPPALERRHGRAELRLPI